MDDDQANATPQLGLGRGRIAVIASLGGAATFAFAVIVVALLGERAEDNALAWTLLGVMAAGLFASLSGLVLEITARARGARSAWGWIPLITFPAIIMFGVLGELLWWE